MMATLALGDQYTISGRQRRSVWSPILMGNAAPAGEAAERRPTVAIAQRVYKLYLQDVQGLDADTLQEMMAIGTVEIIVDVQQAAAWGDTLGHFFDKLERNCDSWRDALHNKTVIVNFIDLHRGSFH